MTERRPHIRPGRRALLLAVAIAAFLPGSALCLTPVDAGEPGTLVQVGLDLSLSGEEALKEAARSVPNVAQREARETRGVVPGEAHVDKRGALRWNGRTPSYDCASPGGQPLYCLHESYLN